MFFLVLEYQYTVQVAIATIYKGCKLMQGMYRTLHFSSALFPNSSNHLLVFHCFSLKQMPVMTKSRAPNNQDKSVWKDVDVTKRRF